MSVLLVAAKRELVEHKVGLLWPMSGLEPSIIDVDAFALHNAFELNYPEAMRGVVGAGQHRPRGHQHQHPRRRRAGPHPRHPGRHPAVPRGPAARARALGRRGRAAAPGLRVERSARCGARGARRGARGRHRAGGAFLQSASRSAGGIGRIFTTGGGARIPRLNQVLADRLRIPVQLANPIEKLQVADGVFDAMPVDEVAPLLMLPIGLALRSAA